MRAGRFRRPNPGDDRGAATVLAAAMVVVLLSVTGAGAYLGSAVVARHRAQAAADLAA
ncbi:pilus assembly protein TadG-related protein, partial [Mycobacterium palustre]|uniref:pilus assembly protein TadG-related protein n=1 Tax=Mycobacterium palustre TaxID=153971 RepID=UPI0021F284E4